MRRFHGEPVGRLRNSILKPRTTRLPWLSRQSACGSNRRRPHTLAASLPVRIPPKSDSGSVSRFGAEFDELDDDEKRRISEMLECDLVSQPQILERLRQGIWTGLVRAKLIAKFTMDRYGVDCAHSSAATSETTINGA